jgi:hypothetical protein
VYEGGAASYALVGPNVPQPAKVRVLVIRISPAIVHRSVFGSRDSADVDDEKDSSSVVDDDVDDMPANCERVKTYGPPSSVTVFNAAAVATNARYESQ